MLSLLLLCFQLILSNDGIHVSNDEESTGSINTFNKLDHILNGDSSDGTNNNNMNDKYSISLQDEVSKLHEPDYLLIGVVKSGSTSLYHYMVQHPEITGVESKFLLPESMRHTISNIIKLRRMGKIPRISKPKSPKQSLAIKSKTMNPQMTVKQDIYEINNFDLARMIKPIIDQKEVRFFDSFWYNHLQTVTNHSLLLGWKWYLEVFNQDEINHKQIRGEASPTYFASSQFTAERIKLWLPNVKLILLLRNPVRRFVSHLKMIKENHAANMKFRKQRQMEMMRNTVKKTHNDNDNDNGRRTLLQLQQMGQYNPFNSMNNMNTMSYNMPFTPQTRYGRNARQSRKRAKRNPMQRFMRTRGNKYNTYQKLLNELQDEIDDEIEEELEDEIDNDIDDEYINNEANIYQQQRNQYSKQKEEEKEEKEDIVKKKMNGRKPVNKMEKIIGSIYVMSMYQVILVSNANAASSTFYQKRWSIGRDVSGFINRLLFGGIYTMRMKEWLKRFDSKHLFYRESSELFDNPVQLMSELETFLGVTPFSDDNWRNITSKVYNVELEKGKGYQHKEVDVQEIEHWDITVEKETKIPYPTKPGKWQSQEIINLLKDYYKPHNKQLSELFDGKKYKDWDY